LAFKGEKMSDKIEIGDLLNGYTIDKDNIQSVGNMTVLPIVSDHEFTNVADQNEVTLKNDPEYGRLTFQNVSGEIGIALQGWTLINDQPAQDRTIPFAHLIKTKGNKTIPANCVQPSQSGHFDVRKLDHSSFMMLAPSLRKLAYDKNSNYKDGNDYSPMWGGLEKWISKNGVNGLQTFYSQYEDKLNEFIAQFEPVKNQLGAIVLINDKIVAVDIVPKYETWKQTWRAFIRDSYGAEAVRAIENGNAEIHTPLLKIEDVETLEDLEAEYTKTKDEFVTGLKSKVSVMAQIAVNRTKQEQINELAMTKLDGSGFKGQALYHGDNHVVYMSLVTDSAQAKGRTSFKSLRNDPYDTGGLSF